MEVTGLLAESSSDSLATEDSERDPWSPRTLTEKTYILSSAMSSMFPNMASPKNPNQDAAIGATGGVFGNAHAVAPAVATSAFRITDLLVSPPGRAASQAPAQAVAGTCDLLQTGFASASPAALHPLPRAPPATPAYERMDTAACAARPGSVAEQQGRNPEDLCSELEAELAEIERRYIAGGESAPSQARRPSPARSRRLDLSQAGSAASGSSGGSNAFSLRSSYGGMPLAAPAGTHTPARPGPSGAPQQLTEPSLATMLLGDTSAGPTRIAQPSILGDQRLGGSLPPGLQEAAAAHPFVSDSSGMTTLDAAVLHQQPAPPQCEVAPGLATARAGASDTLPSARGGPSWASYSRGLPGTAAPLSQALNREANPSHNSAGNDISASSRPVDQMVPSTAAAVTAAPGALPGPVSGGSGSAVQLVQTELLGGHHNPRVAGSCASSVCGATDPGSSHREDDSSWLSCSAAGGGPASVAESSADGSSVTERSPSAASAKSTFPALEALAKAAEALRAAAARTAGRAASAGLPSPGRTDGLQVTSADGAGAACGHTDVVPSSVLVPGTQPPLLSHQPGGHAGQQQSQVSAAPGASAAALAPSQSPGLSLASRGAAAKPHWVDRAAELRSFGQLGPHSQFGASQQPPPHAAPVPMLGHLEAQQAKPPNGGAARSLLALLNSYASDSSSSERTAASSASQQFYSVGSNTAAGSRASVSESNVAGLPLQQPGPADGVQEVAPVTGSQVLPGRQGHVSNALESAQARPPIPMPPAHTALPPPAPQEGTRASTSWPAQGMFPSGSDSSSRHAAAQAAQASVGVAPSAARPSPCSAACATAEESAFSRSASESFSRASRTSSSSLQAALGRAGSQASSGGPSSGSEASLCGMMGQRLVPQERLEQQQLPLGDEVQTALQPRHFTALLLQLHDEQHSRVDEQGRPLMEVGGAGGVTAQHVVATSWLAREEGTAGPGRVVLVREELAPKVPVPQQQQQGPWVERVGLNLLPLVRAEEVKTMVPVYPVQSSPRPLLAQPHSEEQGQPSRPPSAPQPQVPQPAPVQVSQAEGQMGLQESAYELLQRQQQQLQEQMRKLEALQQELLQHHSGHTLRLGLPQQQQQEVSFQQQPLQGLEHQVPTESTQQQQQPAPQSQAQGHPTAVPPRRSVGGRPVEGHRVSGIANPGLEHDCSAPPVADARMGAASSQSADDRPGAATTQADSVGEGVERAGPSERRPQVVAETQTEPAEGRLPTLTLAGTRTDSEGGRQLNLAGTQTNALEKRQLNLAETQTQTDPAEGRQDQQAAEAHSERSDALDSGTLDVSRAEEAALALLAELEQRVELEQQEDSAGGRLDLIGLDEWGLRDMNRRLGHLDLAPGSLVGSARSGFGAAGGTPRSPSEELLRAARLAALDALQTRLSDVQARHNARRQRRHAVRSGAAPAPAPTPGVPGSIGPPAATVLSGASRFPAGRVPSQTSDSTDEPKSLRHILAQLTTPSPAVNRSAAGSGSQGGGRPTGRSGGGGQDAAQDRAQAAQECAGPPAVAIQLSAAPAQLQSGSRPGPMVSAAPSADSDGGSGSGATPAERPAASARGIASAGPALGGVPPGSVPLPPMPPASSGLVGWLLASPAPPSSAAAAPYSAKAAARSQAIADARQCIGNDNIRPPWDVALSASKAGSLPQAAPQQQPLALPAPQRPLGSGIGTGALSSQSGRMDSFRPQPPAKTLFIGSGTSSQLPQPLLAGPSGARQAVDLRSSTSHTSQLYPGSVHKTYTFGPQRVADASASVPASPAPSARLALRPALGGFAAPAPVPALPDTALRTPSRYAVRAPSSLPTTTPAAPRLNVDPAAAPGGALEGASYGGLPLPNSPEEVDELRTLCSLARALPQLDAMQRVQLWERLEQFLAHKLARSPRRGSDGFARGRSASPDDARGAQLRRLMGRSDSPLRGYAAAWDRRQRNGSPRGGDLLSPGTGRGHRRGLSHYEASDLGSVAPVHEAWKGSGAGGSSSGGGAAARGADQTSALLQLLLNQEHGSGISVSAAAARAGSLPACVKRGEGLLDTTLEVVHRVIAPNATLAHAMSLHWQAAKSQAARTETAGTGLTWREVGR